MNFPADTSFRGNGDFRSVSSSEIMPRRFPLEMMDVSAKINRLELTRDLCELESFVLSSNYVSPQEFHSSDPLNIPHRPEPLPLPREISLPKEMPLSLPLPLPQETYFQDRVDFSVEPPPRPECLSEKKDNWEAKYGYVEKEVPREPEVPKQETPSVPAPPVFSMPSANLKIDPSRDYLSMLASTPAVPLPPPKPQKIAGGPVLACEMNREKRGTAKKGQNTIPTWMWTLLSFGGCGTACGAIILGQSFLGMPLAPPILNLGAAVMVSGCVMFLTAGGFSLTKKLTAPC